MSTNLLMLSSFFLLTSFIVSSVLAGEECKIGSKKIMYFFDSSRMACFPIQTIVCSQEATHRYDTLRECQLRRIPRDFNMCAANSPAVKRADGKSHCYRQGTPQYSENNKCPDGSVCNFGFVVGICCDKKIKDQYNNERQARCPEGKKDVRTSGNGFDQPFFGKECSHNFCPSESTCQEGKYLAWCCK